MRIKCAALRDSVGRIYIGRYHGDIFCQRPIGELRKADQGFITHCGKFVDRIEGLRIAELEGQIVKKHSPFDKLMSEDFKCEAEFCIWTGYDYVEYSEYEESFKVYFDTICGFKDYYYPYIPKLGFKYCRHCGKEILLKSIPWDAIKE